MHATDPALWYVDWVWSLPLIVLTVMVHVLGLGLFSEKLISPLSGLMARLPSTVTFMVMTGTTVLLATVLHGLEGAMWAVAYLFLGALPDVTSSMLYSLSSMTSYGHVPLFLKHRWQLMGALEALNGIILFGLTTAFLFGTIERVGPLGRWARRPAP